MLAKSNRCPIPLRSCCRLSLSWEDPKANLTRLVCRILSAFCGTACWARKERSFLVGSLNDGVAASRGDAGASSGGSAMAFVRLGLELLGVEDEGEVVRTMGPQSGDALCF